MLLRNGEVGRASGRRLALLGMRGRGLRAVRDGDHRRGRGELLGQHRCPARRFEGHRAELRHRPQRRPAEFSGEGAIPALHGRDREHQAEGPPRSDRSHGEHLPVHGRRAWIGPDHAGRVHGRRRRGQRPAGRRSGEVPEPDFRQSDQGARLQRADFDRGDDEHQIAGHLASHPERRRVRDASAREPLVPGLAAQAAAGPRGWIEVFRLSNLAISAHDLAATYGTRTVWSRATFDIEAGSFTAILGPNGSGKTTLIRTILGRLAPSAGKLEVFGRTPRRGDPTIGYVPQRPVFDPELSIRGRDFVELGFDGHRWGVRLVGRARAAAAAEASLEAVGAVDYSDQPLGRLSGGEQQRMLLAQALVGSPRLLLMDEPLYYLDVRNQRAMVQLIRDVARRRELTVLLIAHDVNPLLPHIDHVLYMAAGKVSMGTPAEIITTERLSEIYSSPVEVVRDSRGRVFVVGLEEEASHPHG